MGLEKAGLNLTKEIIACWKKSSNRSFLVNNPIEVNTVGLKLSNLKSDVVQLSKQSKRWTKHPNEYIPNCNIPNSAIPSHHKIDGRNGSLREVCALKEGTVDDCEMLSGYYAIKCDKEFAKLTPLEKDCIGYRIIGRQNNPNKDIPFNIIENAKVGDKVILDEGCAYAFQQEGLISLNNYNLKNPMIEVIRIPEGARVSRNMEHGGEILMPRGAEYKLISKEVTKDGKIKVVLEYILPDSKYPNDIQQIKKVALQHINSEDKYIQKYAQKILDEIETLNSI